MKRTRRKKNTSYHFTYSKMLGSQRNQVVNPDAWPEKVWDLGRGDEGELEN